MGVSPFLIAGRVKLYTPAAITAIIQVSPYILYLCIFLFVVYYDV